MRKIVFPVLAALALAAAPVPSAAATARHPTCPAPDSRSPGPGFVCWATVTTSDAKDRCLIAVTRMVFLRIVKEGTCAARRDGTGYDMWVRLVGPGGGNRAGTPLGAAGPR